ncbi:MAG: SGNH/GDSL hydrolase family protein [Planctomycetes bacterium]|nr:SGNH/GDSL hydrolase family protein [Planctomycetota bacterium]
MAKTTRMLFIGNSYTFCNELPKMLEALVADAAGRPALETQFSGEGGWTFEKHWEHGAAGKLLEQGGWSHVVLQEQTRRPYEDTPKFREFAMRFSELARKHGAKTVLYLTWAPEAEPDKQAPLNKAYGELARALGAELVPSGSAFERALIQTPGVDLFVEDRRHPSPAGSYLSACCFFSWLRGASPEGRTARVLPGGAALPGCTAEQVQALQRIAWQAWCDWRDGKIVF